MSAIDLLQQLGLNKYDAEAYYTLLCQGPLTGYELAKRSGIPLSRSYEVLERLTRKGLAVVQPGDPPRYAAEAQSRVVQRFRQRAAQTLDALDGALAALTPPDAAEDFWVLRGRKNVLTRTRELIEGAEETVALQLPADVEDDAEEVLHEARSRGCRTELRRAEAPSGLLIALVDRREALVGTTAPPEHCQAVVSANPALVAVVERYFGPAQPLEWQTAPALEEPLQHDWLDWDLRKHRRLWALAAAPDVA